MPMKSRCTNERREEQGAALDRMASLADNFLVWLCVVLPCTYLLSLIFRKTSKLPPGPAGFPVVGSLLQMGNMPHETLSRLAKKYGPIMTVQLGFKTTVVVSSAEMAEEVLHRQNNVFSGRNVADVATVYGYDQHSFGLSQVGPRWRELRKLCNTELFTPKRLDALRGLREEKVGDLVRHIRGACADRRPVDISKCAFATTLNLMSNTLFSEDLIDLESESTGEFKRFMVELLGLTAQPNLCDYFPVLRWIDPQGLRRHTGKILDRVYAIFDEMIDKHLKAYEEAAAKGEPRKNEDFLDVLLELTRDPNSGFTIENIRPLLAELFAAGTDTSSNTIEWAMTELLRHPDKMAAARSELKQTIGTGTLVKESDIPHLPYLEAVLKETLRLHPPAPLLLPRRADAATKVAGFTIPKHTQVFVNAWVISNDTTKWDNPSSFLPERFIGSDVSFKGKDFQLIPFGAGRRICPGLPLANRMILLVLGSLVNSFSWELPDKKALEEIDVEAVFKLGLHKAVPLKVIPSPLTEM